MYQLILNFTSSYFLSSQTEASSFTTNSELSLTAIWDKAWPKPYPNCPSWWPNPYLVLTKSQLELQECFDYNHNLKKLHVFLYSAMTTK